MPVNWWHQSKYAGKVFNNLQLTITLIVILFQQIPMNSLLEMRAIFIDCTNDSLSEYKQTLDIKLQKTTFTLNRIRSLGTILGWFTGAFDFGTEYSAESSNALASE